MSSTAALNARPQALRKDVEIACEAAMVIALTISVELNVYDHIKIGRMVALIGWSVGITVPVLVAILAHAAAHVNFHWTVKAWVGGIVAVLMYVSATAGSRVLSPGMGAGPATATAFGMDLAALTTLGVLMYSAARKAAIRAWDEREEAHREQARIDVITARYGKGAGQVSAPGAGGGISRGAAGGISGGITPPAVEGSASHPAITAGSPAPEDAAPGDSETGQDGDATVTPLVRRPYQSPDEMLTAAAIMAAELAVIGEPITGRGYRTQHGGKPARINPVIKEVTEAMNQLGDRPAAEQIITVVLAARDRAGQGTTAGAQ